MSLSLTSIYGHNEDRPAYYRALNQNLCDHTSEKIVVGDFNLVLNVELDRYGSSSNHPKALKAVQELMTDFNLEDVWRNRNEHTTRFSWRRMDGAQASRIDFALMSKSIENKCENITYMQAILTDHSALFMSINDRQHERGPGFWKCNSSLLNNTETLHELQVAIKKDVGVIKKMEINPVQKWEKLKKRLTKLLKNESRKTANDRNLLISQLSEKVCIYEESFPLQKDAQLVYEMTKAELNCLLEEKTRGILMRCGVKWYEEGEKNTRYFLGLEKQRSNGKVCDSILLDDGRITNNLPEIMNEQHRFYSELYKSDPNIRFCIDKDDGVCISQEQIKDLNKPFSLEELKSAAFEMKKEKAPGPDGLSVEIYQAFWESIGELLFESLKFSQQSGEMNPSAMRGVLNLIPKANKDSRVLKNLRPITLLNVDYKIMEKLLAKRVQSILPTIIHNDQTGFMAGRSMALNVRKIFDLMTICEKRDIDAFILNLDYMKAFNRPELQSIIASMEYFKIPPLITEWIKILYKNFTVRIQNNGYFTEDVRIERSVHQGGCISAFLYIILAEVLAIQMRQSESVQGIQIGEFTHKVNQFADDTNASTLTNQEQLNNLLEMFDQFHDHSGLAINYEKTSLYRIGSMKHAIPRLYTQKNISWEDVGINVLGTLVTHKNAAMANYEAAIVKGRSVLNSWKRRSLSVIGKVTVFNTLVASLLTHRMQVLPKIPSTIISQLNTMTSEFIWNGRSKIPMWILKCPKKDGGLNLADISIRDKAQKISWIQKLKADPKCADLAYQLMNYTLKHDIFKCNLKTEDIKHLKIESDFWKSVLEAWSEYTQKCCKDDQKLFLWWNSDIRINNKPFFFAAQYTKGLEWIPQLYHEGNLISANEAKERFGLDVMTFNSIISAVPPHLKQLAKSTSIQKLPQPECEALLHRRNLSSHVYNVMNAGKAGHIVARIQERWQNVTHLANNQIKNQWRMIYSLTNVPKLRSYQYRLIHKALVLNTHLFRWEMRSDNLCSFCEAHPETIDHHLWECDKVQDLWHKVKDYMCTKWNTEVALSFQNVLLNTIASKGNICNFVCLIIKQFIYRQRCGAHGLNFNELKGYITSIESKEKYIATKHGHLIKHEQKWK